MDLTTVNNLIVSGRYHEAAELLTMNEKPALEDPCIVMEYLKPWQFRTRECFVTVTLDVGLKVLGVHEVATGLMDEVSVHPREVFRPAFLDMASRIIIAHNHPSGEMEFSDEDAKITVKMQEAGELLGIPVLDHILISRNGFKSMLEVEDGGHNDVSGQ